MLLPLWVALITWAAGIRLSRHLATAWLGLTIGCGSWIALRAWLLAAHGGEILPDDPGYRFPFVVSLVPGRTALVVLTCFVPTTGRALTEFAHPAPVLFALGVVAAAYCAFRNSGLRAFLSAARSLVIVVALVVSVTAFVGLRPDMRGSRYFYLASAFACMTLGSVFRDALATRSKPITLMAWTALLVVVSANTWSTLRVVSRWREAGDLAQGLVASFPICDSANGPVYVEDVPEHVEGAYVFKNAFHLALIIERGCDVKVHYGRAPSLELTSLTWQREAEAWVPLE